MATIQLYKNKYRYPHYTNTITAAGPELPCTPVGLNLKSGTLRVAGSMDDFMNCNYLRLSRGGYTLFAWIDDVRFHTADSFELSYSVDAWRTYRSKINLGTQFIARQPEPTTKKDNLLGSSTDYPEVTSYRYSMGDATKRILVVQVRAAAGEIYSRTPVQPTPYQFYMLEYDFQNWLASMPLVKMIEQLSDGAQPENIVTMYSIPHVDISSLGAGSLPITTGDGDTVRIEGFKVLLNDDITNMFRNEAVINIGHSDIDALLRVNHSVKIVIPEAGIIDIPDELLQYDDLTLRQDIDIFSGASNYMLKANGDKYYTQSVRGSSISSIPIVGDPLDTYLSQNQNALATSLIGDVASIAMGGAAAYVTGGLGAAVGASMATSGVNNIVNRMAGQADMANQMSNPPAFLGTALVTNFNQRFWVVVHRSGVENDVQVHTNFGYPINLVGALSFPAAGFVQTEGCNVTSTDGTVPAWAMAEINTMFNNGVLVH